MGRHINQQEMEKIKDRADNITKGGDFDLFDALHDALNDRRILLNEISLLKEDIEEEKRDYKFLYDGDYLARKAYAHKMELRANAAESDNTRLHMENARLFNKLDWAMLKLRGRCDTCCFMDDCPKHNDSNSKECIWHNFCADWKWNFIG